MKIAAILVLVILAELSFLAFGVEYDTLDTKYFKVEYPAEWTVTEWKGSAVDWDMLGWDTFGYDFGIPFKDKKGRLYSSNSVQVGLNGVQISLRIDPRLKGMFNEDGSINESLIHFLETFKVKKSNIQPHSL